MAQNTASCIFRENWHVELCHLVQHSKVPFLCHDHNCIIILFLPSFSSFRWEMWEPPALGNMSHQTVLSHSERDFRRSHSQRPEPLACPSQGWESSSHWSPGQPGGHSEIALHFGIFCRNLSSAFECMPCLLKKIPKLKALKLEVSHLTILT